MKPYLHDADLTVYNGDALEVLHALPAESVHTVVTSPPYWGLRDYGVDGQLGLELSPEEYVARMVEVFHEVRRVLRSDGTCWLNIGDSYVSNPNGGTGWDSSTLTKPNGRARKVQIAQEASKSKVARVEGLKTKDLVGVPWLLAFALRADGWYLRADIIWSKPNPMPESVTDRPTKAHETVFLLTKSARYFYDADAIREPAEYGRRKWSSTAGNLAGAGINGKRGSATVSGADPSAGRNKRSVWEIATEPYPDAHFATFPQALVEPCILAGCPDGGIVLDPFLGSGTTAFVARRLGRRCVGIELNADYCELIARRTRQLSILGEATA